MAVNIPRTNKHTTPVHTSVPSGDGGVRHKDTARGGIFNGIKSSRRRRKSGRITIQIANKCLILILAICVAGLASLPLPIIILGSWSNYNFAETGHCLAVYVDVVIKFHSIR